MAILLRGSETARSDRHAHSGVLPYLSAEIRSKFTAAVELLSIEKVISIQEIRVSAYKPLIIVFSGGEVMVRPDGGLTYDAREAYCPNMDEIQYTIQLLTDCSVYAVEEEIRNGYLTIQGGHRVGIAGHTVITSGKIKTIRPISSLCIRLSRQIRGISETIMPWIFDNQSMIPHNTLIISPPGCGKTTLLRDVVRRISNGKPNAGLKGLRVGLVDERSEIAACYQGIPQNDIGIRTDVLDSCPKAEGIILLIRAMSPQVIATDEIGKPQDVEAILDAIGAGVSVMATVHGYDAQDVLKRPALRQIFDENGFQRIVVLSKILGAGTLQYVMDMETKKYLLHGPIRLGKGKDELC